MSAGIQLDQRARLTNVLISANTTAEYGVQVAADTVIDGLRITATPAWTIADVYLEGDRVLMSEVHVSSPEELGLLVGGFRSQVRNMFIGGGSTSNHVIVTGNDHQLELTSAQGGDGTSTDSAAIQIDGDYNRLVAIVYDPNTNGVVVTGNRNRVEASITNLTPSPNDTLDLVRLMDTADRNSIKECVMETDATGNRCRSAVYLDTNTTDNWVDGNDFDEAANYATGVVDDNGTGNVIGTNYS
jgi:hypothetical protein